MRCHSSLCTSHAEAIPCPTNLLVYSRTKERVSFFLPSSLLFFPAAVGSGDCTQVVGCYNVRDLPNRDHPVLMHISRGCKETLSSMRKYKQNSVLQTQCPTESEHALKHLWTTVPNVQDLVLIDVHMKSSILPNACVHGLKPNVVYY
jgi:hypothetical protein